MSLILNIDTAVQAASICLAQDTTSLGVKVNPIQKDHAAWLHTAIKDLLSEQNLTLHDLDAVAISAGPGSYTGLRVSMSAAKGICYALHLPLIRINTLQMMAVAMQNAPTDLLCPMIDARRLEVFTAVFDHQLNEIQSTTNMILDASSFAEILDQQSISFFGNGSDKFQAIVKHHHAVFAKPDISAFHMTSLSSLKFNLRDFADLAYSEPYYGKDFHSLSKQSL